MRWTLLSLHLRLGKVVKMSEVYFLMKQSVYTASLKDQSPGEALNSVLWRLAVATGLVEKGATRAQIDMDQVIARAEERLSIYNG